MEAFRQLRANLKMQGNTCPWCQKAVELGEPMAVCNSCQAEQHSACWEAKGGCATTECVQAPLKQFDLPVSERMSFQAPPGLTVCPVCQGLSPVDVKRCHFCRTILNPSGRASVAPKTAPGADNSVAYGVLGLLFFGFAFGPLAIYNAHKAKRIIAMDPDEYVGSGRASVGTVLGALATILWSLWLVMQLSR